MSVDASLIHTGIRRMDIEEIQRFCMENQVDYDWFFDCVLKPYHELITVKDSHEPKDIQALLNKALQQLPA